MTTRLNKTIRQQIVDAIYKASDLPKRLEYLERAGKDKAAELIKASRPSEFVAMTEGKPKEWFASTSCIYLGHHQYDPVTKARIDFDSDEHAFGNYRVTLDDPVVCPKNHDSTEYTTAFYVWVRDVHTPLYKKWLADRDELHLNASSMVNSFRTVEALLKAAPEMKQFVPKSNQVFPLAVPIQNVVATFLARGVKFEEVPA